jgi:hypothetical protein
VDATINNPSKSTSESGREKGFGLVFSIWRVRTERGGDEVTRDLKP